MKVEELRIGNLVNSVLTNETKTVDSWALRIIEDGNYQNSHDTITKVFEPIPLTEEWLIKLGFEPLPFVNLLNSYTKSIGRNRILSIGSVGTPNEMIWLCEVNAVDKKIIDDLVCIRNYDYDKYTHVHQLQNLYYALTGEELVLGEA